MTRNACRLAVSSRLTSRLLLPALLSAILLLGALPDSRAVAGVPSPWPAEQRVMQVAAERLAHAGRGSVLHWLRRQPAVAGAFLGRDGRTVEIRFRSGLSTAILPHEQGIAAVSRNWARRVATATPGTAPRAVVLEPFATELNLGPHAGDVEVDDLQANGYQVDQYYDGAVTLSVMSTLSNYSVVYMLTHSGVNQWGEGVIATGQVANSDPTVDPLIKEFSVLVVGVVGSDTMYYGIMSHYITYHVGQFPAHSFMFINGCSMLTASLFWKALQAKGVAALVSWDHDAMAVDDTAAAEGFFGAMHQGQNIDAAVRVVKASGHGVSNPAGEPAATFGYLGDGTLTLQQLNPAPTATATPYATPIPGFTGGTTAGGPGIALLKHVNPGQEQQVSILAPPGDAVRLTVRYPNGQRRTVHLTSGAGGVVTYAYRQPASMITRRHSLARVTVTDTRTGTAASTTYTIGRGKFDLSVSPSRVRAGHRVSFWMYSAKTGTARIGIRLRKVPVHRIYVRLPAHHWMEVLYQVPPKLTHVRLVIRATFYGLGTANRPLTVR